MNATNDLLKPEQNILLNARKTDETAGALLNDIAHYIVTEDYRRAAQACAYLLIHLARKSAQKPFSLLHTANS